MTHSKIDVINSALRGVLIPASGKKFVIADLANIEGRVLAWLAHEDWKLKAFYDYDKGIGSDLYKLAYAKAFGVTPESVTSDQRQVGKVMELALGYQGGVGAFLTFAAAYRIDLEAMGKLAINTIPADVRHESENFLAWMNEKGTNRYGLSDDAFIVCDSFKRLWRMAHPNIEHYWKKLEIACHNAIQNPGNTQDCFRHKIRRDGQWLRILLPSGRYLCYVHPELSDDKISYMGKNQYTRKWTRLSTYGGKLAENITQAVARDILAWSMPEIEKAGYEIVLTVHDEIIAEAPDSLEFNAEHLSAIMVAENKWSEGLPLAAKGFESYRYRKE